MKTGLFGGTFDPVHTGHLIIAETVCSDFQLNRILFIPVGIPPHKSGMRLTASKHRLAMLNLAVKTVPRFSVSDLELKNPDTSYTIDTVRSLHSVRSSEHEQFFFIMGSDSLLDLPDWKSHDRLLDETVVVVYPRRGFDIGHAEARFLERIKTIDAPEIGISSTLVRRRAAGGRSIRFWVPDSVAEYIRKKGLYRS